MPLLTLPVITSTTLITGAIIDAATETSPAIYTLVNPDNSSLFLQFDFHRAHHISFTVPNGLVDEHVGVSTDSTTGTFETRLAGQSFIVISGYDTTISGSGHAVSLNLAEGTHTSAVLSGASLYVGRIDA